MAAGELSGPECVQGAGRVARELAATDVADHDRRMDNLERVMGLIRAEWAPRCPHCGADRATA